MWNYINELPQIISGNLIFGFLDLKSIAILERALAGSKMQRTFRNLLKFLPTIKINLKLPQECKTLKWLNKRQCRILEATVHWNMMETELAHLEIDLIDEIVLHVDNAATLNQILIIPENFCIKISRVLSNEWDGAVIKVLLVRLIPMRKLRRILLCCDIEAWFADMLRELFTKGSIDIEYIEFNTQEYISDRTMKAIVECCPKLLSFQSQHSYGRLTHTSLVALSEHSLSHTEFYYPLWIPIPSATIASQCAYTLSRIHRIETPTAATTPALYSVAIPYLSNLRRLVLSSPIDHLLLPVFSLYPLPIETLNYFIYSSATAETLLQLVRTVGKTLRTLVFQRTTQIVTDELLLAILPHCPQLTQLSIGTHGPTEQVTDASLLALSEQCRLLEELSIVPCRTVTEAAVLQLIHSCPHISLMYLPLGCLSEDTVLTLPVTSKSISYQTLVFKSNSRLYLSEA